MRVKLDVYFNRVIGSSGLRKKDLLEVLAFASAADPNGPGQPFGDRMAETQDTEITLGTGKLLGIFFVLVAICGVFFTMGYLLGRSSTPTGASTTIVSTVPSSGGNTANKPSANGGKTPETAGCAAGSTNCVAASYA